MPVAILLIVLFVSAYRHLKNQRLDREAIREITSFPPHIIREKCAVLARKKKQLMIANDYGIVDGVAWQKEMNNFISNVVFAVIHPVYCRDVVRPLLIAQIESSVSLAPTDNAFDPKMPPLEYEEYCAEILRREGWAAKKTKSSGDQGADVVAERGGCVLVLQCKLYNYLVSNKAVQEAHTSMAYYGATHAAVVTNQGFTTSAKRLAAANGVSLVHHDDLAAFSANLGQSASRRDALPHLQVVA